MCFFLYSDKLFGPSHLTCLPTYRKTGLISFSELVHLDVWMNSREPSVEIALRLANKDAGR